MRQIWILLGWSSEHGLPIRLIAVLGLDGTADRHVEWIPREYDSVWRERIATTPPQETSASLRRWAESATAPAVQVEPQPAPDLAAAVQRQLDDLL
ncbi:hypothetical protein [Amycolatopsis magusensis]|uniref:hypothetical protein n=1 Tax=Amycolatopsis magusensis TaxID=882444 RepID=UPI0037ACC465